MRRLRLLADLLNPPAAILLIVIVVLGNLQGVLGLFPQARSAADSLTRDAWLAQTLAWLAGNWLYGFLIVLAVALFEGAYRRLGAYYWPQSLVEFTPQVETNHTARGTASYARLLAHNRQDQNITDCTATLERGSNLAGPKMSEVTAIRNNRLRWSDEFPSGDDCTLTLPRHPAKRSIAVGDTAKGFQFASCKPASAGGGPLGFYVVRIRLDGKLRGQPIKPQYFEGYLHVEQARNGSDLSLIFEAGDWQNDKRLRKLKRPRRFFWQR